MTDFDIDAFFEHHGIKGQKWGVRRNLDDSSGGGFGTEVKKTPEQQSQQNESSKEYMRSLDKLRSVKKSPQQIHADFQENKKKFLEKHDISLTPNEKKALIAGGAVVIIGGGLLVAKHYGAHMPELNYEEAKLLAKRAQVPDEREFWMGKAGDHVTQQEFMHLVNDSSARSWGLTGYVQPSSFKRPEIELPVGHVFHRVSNNAETTFRKSGTTYCTPNIACYYRYVNGFYPGNYHVTFKATEPIKVPHITTVLDTLREVMAHDSGHGILPTRISPDDVIRRYELMSGGSFESKQAQKLFSALAKKGYGAIVDEMDAGVIGERPLVLFAKGVSEKVADPVTDSLIKTAEKNLTEMSFRK